jgi:hypothetical protein
MRELEKLYSGGGDSSIWGGEVENNQDHIYFKFISTSRISG